MHSQDSEFVALCARGDAKDVRKMLTRQLQQSVLQLNHDRSELPNVEIAISAILAPIDSSTIWDLMSALNLLALPKTAAYSCALKRVAARPSLHTNLTPTLIRSSATLLFMRISDKEGVRYGSSPIRSKSICTRPILDALLELDRLPQARIRTLEVETFRVELLQRTGRYAEAEALSTSTLEGPNAPQRPTA